MKIKMLLLTVLVVAGVSNTHAGQGTGNGGVSVVCRSSQGKILSAEILDLFEGREVFDLSYDEDTLNVEKRIKLAQLSLINHPTYLQQLKKELAYIKANLIFVSSKVELTATNDAFPVIGRKGCKFEQLANYTNEGEIIVSKEIYNALDTNNKAALFIHEAVYAIRRKSGETTSQKSRRLVAHLMADDGDQREIDRLVKPAANTAAKGPCGLKGSIEQRIKECSTTKEDWQLVVRTRRNQEVWKDPASGLIWSDVMYPQSCDNESEAKGWISGAWALPSPEQYLTADKNGIRYVMKDFGFDWLTSHYTSHNDRRHGPYRIVTTFNGIDGTFSSQEGISGNIKCIMWHSR